MKHKKVKWLAAFSCMAAAGLLYSCSVSVGIETSGEEEIGAALYEEEAVIYYTAGEEYDEAPKQLYVYVCGEVIKPGVYVLEEGDRIFKAVELAGGFTPEAAREYLNLAQEVTDGAKIVVPSKDELENISIFIPDQTYAEDKKVNINTASADELMTLRGIGEVRAKDIIAYRDEHGAFARIEDIMNVSGIKETVFQKIKDDITV